MSETNEKAKVLNEIKHENTTQKTYTEEYVNALKEENQNYVHSLREEAKNWRLNTRKYETKLKEVLGLNPNADLENVDDLITNFKTNQSKTIEQALNKSKELMLKAEIKALSNNYNTKLLDRLLDKSKISIDDDGKVVGLDDVLKEIETEFPEIRLNQAIEEPKLVQSSIIPNPVSGSSVSQPIMEQYKQALSSGNVAEAIALKNKLYKIE